MPYVDLNSQKPKEIAPGYFATFSHGEFLTASYVRVTAGACLPEHSHPHEQITSIIEGQFEFTLKGEARLIEPGTSVVIPSGEKHSGRALSDCYLIDVFHPTRDDFKSME